MPTSADLCARCGHEEREPYTPAAFSMLEECDHCGRRLCSRCADHDADCIGDPPQYVGRRTCKGGCAP